MPRSRRFSSLTPYCTPPYNRYIYIYPFIYIYMFMYAYNVYTRAPARPPTHPHTVVYNAFAANTRREKKKLLKNTIFSPTVCFLFFYTHNNNIIYIQPCDGFVSHIRRRRRRRRTPIVWVLLLLIFFRPIFVYFLPLFLSREKIITTKTRGGVQRHSNRRAKLVTRQTQYLYTCVTQWLYEKWTLRVRFVYVRTRA